MYSRFFNLSERPFKPAPDPRYLYLSPGHREALASILYSIHGHNGIVAIVGEVGTGKTTVMRVAHKMVKRRVKTAYIFNPHLPFRQIFPMILFELNLLRTKERISKANAIRRLNRLAIKELASCGNVVIFLDEAHHLSDATFENLRLLTNLESAGKKLIQIVLAGQPELLTKLQQPKLRQFHQRINTLREIKPLNQIQTYRYIQHRLMVADRKGPPIFEKKALKMIWRFSGGIPRLINNLCENALLEAYTEGSHTVPALCVKEIAQRLSLARRGVDWNLRNAFTFEWLSAR